MHLSNTQINHSTTRKQMSFFIKTHAKKFTWLSSEAALVQADGKLN
jgi:hypothetical protein